MENWGANLAVIARLVAGTGEQKAAVADCEAKRWIGELRRSAFRVLCLQVED